MFRKILVIVLTALSTVVHAQDGDSLEVHDDWRLEKDDDGVRVYVRWKKNEEGIKTRQLRVEMIIQSSISAVVAVVKDDVNAEEWINRAEEFYNFDTRDDHHWYSYTEFDVPWPLNNQDLVTSNYLIQDIGSKSVNIEIRNDPQKIPVKKNIERLPGFEGSWEIIPWHGGKVMVTYKIYTGQRPWLPRWIVDPIVQYGLWKTLVDMREVILEKNRLSTRLEYISE